ncbi:MAG: HipA N-terminal domain-containing protein [Desulfopila sp.]
MKKCRYEYINCFSDQQEVGKISRHPQGKISFQYSTEWLVNSGKPISLSLPCREEKFAPGVSTAFFENLCPENEARNILALNHRFDKKDTFAFLENFGEDCAGALTIIAEHKEINEDPGKYRCINSDLKAALDSIKMDPDRYKLYPAVPNLLTACFYWCPRHESNMRHQD